MIVEALRGTTDRLYSPNRGRSRRLTNDSSLRVVFSLGNRFRCVGGMMPVLGRCWQHDF
jgi:hypothetical protein